MRASTWITRFVNNFRKIKKRGPQTTSEIQRQDKFYIKREKRKIEHSERFQESKKQLNLQLNCEGTWSVRAECREFTRYNTSTGAFTSPVAFNLAISLPLSIWLYHFFGDVQYGGHKAMTE